MADETLITVVGNLTGDPELRFVNNGTAVANFSVAHNGRRFNRQTNEWEDTEATFYPCNIWGTGAENVANALRKGMPVIVTGFLASRSWEQDGQTRSRMEVKVKEIGPNLMRVTIEAANIQRSNPSAQGRGQQGGGNATAAPSTGNGGDNDPWASAPQAEDPPF